MEATSSLEGLRKPVNRLEVIHGFLQTYSRLLLEVLHQRKLDPVGFGIG